MNISKKIDEIIDRRQGRGDYEGKGHLRVIKNQKDFFETLEKRLKEYQIFRSNVLQQIQAQKGEYYVISQEDPTFLSKVEAASPDAMLGDLRKCIDECSRLENRFSREAINISVIGRAGQGKSQLLQSISGLKNDIIPASSGGDCTGAKSVICNENGSTYADIIFYSEKELLEYVQKYLTTLQCNINIGSVKDVKNINIDEIKERMPNTAAAASHFMHFRKYVDHFEDYIGTLGSTKRIDESQIKLYVAQYITKDGKEIPLYNYLSVKEVMIFTKFDFSDAGKVMLVDTIGLGDTALGIQDKMFEALVNDSDAAIILRKPDPDRDGVRQEDNDLYDSINSKMQGRSLDKWLFYVLNVYEKNNNFKTGEILKKALNDQKKQNKLQIALLTTIDCANNKVVEKDLLIPMLESLSNNLTTVDNDLMQGVNAFFEKVYHDYYSLNGKITQVLNNSFKKNANIGGTFDKLYSDFLSSNLSPKLMELQCRYMNSKKCDEIKDEINKITNNIVHLFPELNSISHRLLAGGPDAHPNNVLNHYADTTRAKICDQFESINNSTIATLQKGVKCEIINILYSSDGGKLSSIPVSVDFNQNDPCEWLKCFIDQKLTDYPIIKDAFASILNYRLNIEGLLEYKVNRSLVFLEPNSAEFPGIQFKGLTSDKYADIIEQSLLNTISDISDTLKSSIDDLLLIPHNSFFARIRKLREKIIFSEDGKMELRDFYRENCTSIWHNEFMTIIDKQAAVGEWNRYNEEMSTLCKKEKFIIQIQ